jgi:ubiquitin carboxyl-terminal hydrolase 4/11/15
MEKSLNEVDGVGVMSMVKDEIDAYMLEQDDPVHHQAPNGLNPTPQPAPPSVMPRVQTVPVREKWDAIGLLYSLRLHLSALQCSSQLPFLGKLKYTSLKEGDTWYLISIPWLGQWKQRCDPKQYKGDDSTLGPVDNSDLVDEHGALLPALQEGSKYEIICKEAWDLFVGWYVHFP